MKISSVSGAEQEVWANEHASNSNARWTQHEVERLMNFANRDMSPAMIANRLGRSISSVKIKAIELGLKLPSRNY